MQPRTKTSLFLTALSFAFVILLVVSVSLCGVYGCKNAGAKQAPAPAPAAAPVGVTPVPVDQAPTPDGTAPCLDADGNEFPHGYRYAVSPGGIFECVDGTFVQVADSR